MMEKALQQAAEKALSPKGSKILSVIGSCVTNSQLESCKHWINRLAKDSDEFAIYSFVITMQFGRINGPEFDV